MVCRIICSQGRIGDKSDATLRGAKLTAEWLAERFHTNPTIVGRPSPAKQDKWTEALPEAAETLALLQSEVQRSLQAPGTTILALNTCSASLATLPAVAAQHPDIKVLWIDAHGDFNTPESSDTGYLGGMVLGAACGLWQSGYGAGLHPSQLILTGVHDIDEKERLLLNDNHVLVLSPQRATPDEVVKAIGEAKLWIHIDWDVLEPGQINADYKVNGGMHLDQLIEIIEKIPQAQLLGLELAEFSADNFDSELNKKSLSNISRLVNSLFQK